MRVWFDADANNQNIYTRDGFYGIDEYGDVVLTRQYTNAYGNARMVNDVLPLFRGGFTSPDGVEYSAVQSPDYLSAFNLKVTQFTQNKRLSLDNPIN